MKSLFQRRSLMVNGALGVLLAGGVGFAYFSLTDQGASAGATTRTAQVTRGTVQTSVSASGSVASSTTRELDFETSGTVTHIYVKVGQKVAKGKVLARLDQTSALESINATKAALAVADAADTTTAQGYSAYVSAKNNYNSAERAYAGTVLKAPISGTVTALNGSVGGSSSGTSSSSSSSTGSTGSTGSSGSSGSSSTTSSSTSSTTSTGFIELSKTSSLEVTGAFTEADTTKLKTGQAASVTFDALSGVTATGKVSAIDVSPTTTNNVVTYGVTVTLTTHPSSVRIGQTATVVVSTGSKSNVLYVSSAAVKTAGGQSTVTVMQNGKPVVKTVQIGLVGDSGTEIKSGLKQGDQVVIASAAPGSSTSTTTRIPGGGGAGGIPGGGGGGGGGRPGG